MAGYAGMLFVPGGLQADVLTIAVRESHWGLGIGSALLDALLGAARERDCAEVFLEVRADNPAGARALPAARVRGDRRAPRLLQAVRGGRDRDAEGSAAMTNLTDGPLVLGIETSCDETGVGHRARPGTARRRGGVVDGPARPVRRRGARGGQPGAPGGDGPGHRGRVRQGRGPAGRHRRGRGDRGARPGRRAHGGRGGGEGLRLRPRQAAVRGQPPGRARGRRPARARAAARALPGAAGLRRPLVAAARARHHRRGALARRDDRRRGGRGLRQGGPGARHAVPRRPADRPGGRRRATRPRSGSRARSCTTAATTSPSPG